MYSLQSHLLLLEAFDPDEIYPDFYSIYKLQSLSSAPIEKVYLSRIKA